MRFSSVGAVRSLLMLSILGSVAAVPPAQAADLPGKAAPAAVEEEGEAPPPMPVFSWAGPYAGLREELQGSIRARAGIGVRRVLYYGTGGLAIGQIRTDVPGAAAPGADHTRLGYTLGGGVAYAMTNHVALRAEYRYTDFGHTSDMPGVAGIDGATITHRDNVQRLQGGISYLFADPAPVNRVD